MMNTLKVFVLMAVLTAAIAGLGRIIGGPAGMLMAFGFAILLNFGSFWFSDKIVLKMTGAQPVDAQSAPELHRMTRDLCERANLPMPRLYIIEDPQPNAFATGRSPQNAAVAVNTGLLDLLNRSEIEGVVAHELAHVKHRDTLTMTIVATLAGAFMMLVDIARFGAIFGGGSSDDEGGMSWPVLIAMSIVGPIAAMMIQSAVSRAREFEADKMAAMLTGSPNGLIGALSKLERGAQMIPNHAMSPQTAHMCIVNPFAGMGGVLLSLFSTHPPMDKRIAALEALRSQVRPVGANPWA